MFSDFQSEFLSYVESSSPSEGNQEEEGHVKDIEITELPADLTTPKKEAKAECDKQKISAPVASTSTSPYGTRRQKSGIVKTKNYCVLLGKIQDKFPVVKGAKKPNVSIHKRKITPTSGSKSRERSVL